MEVKMIYKHPRWFLTWKEITSLSEGEPGTRPTQHKHTPPLPSPLAAQTPWQTPLQRASLFHTSKFFYIKYISSILYNSCIFVIMTRKSNQRDNSARALFLDITYMKFCFPLLATDSFPRCLPRRPPRPPWILGSQRKGRVGEDR